MHECLIIALLLNVYCGTTFALKRNRQEVHGEAKNMGWCKRFGCKGVCIYRRLRVNISRARRRRYDAVNFVELRTTEGRRVRYGEDARSHSCTFVRKMLDNRRSMLMLMLCHVELHRRWKDVLLVIGATCVGRDCEGIGVVLLARWGYWHIIGIH